MKINPDPLKDQFFLVNRKIIRKLTEFAQLSKNDVVRIVVNDANSPSMGVFDYVLGSIKIENTD